MNTETFPAALRRLRQDRGLSLAELGALVNYSRKTVWSWENNRPAPAPEVVQALDNALRADGHLVQLAALATLTGEQPPAPEGDLPTLPGDTWTRGDAEALATALVTQAPTAGNALALAHAWLVIDPPQRFHLAAGRSIDHGLVDELAHRVHQIRLIDDHVGGHDTQALASAELSATADLLRDATYTEDVGRRLLSVVAELAQIAGWVTSDAGQHQRAQQLYLAGAHAAHAAGDTAGAASNLSSLAYQIANVGDPRDAILLARTALRGAEDRAGPPTRALLLERAAWAYARAGEADAAGRTLDQVDDVFEPPRPGEDPLFTYWLNRDEIDVMRGRVWTELRRPLRAVPALERAIAAYGEEVPRETALYLTWLAESLLQGHEVDRAAEVATRAAQLARGAGSDRATQRVSVLRRLLAPHAGQPAVDRFLESGQG